MNSIWADLSKEKSMENNIVEYNGTLGTIGILALGVILLSNFAGCATKSVSFEKANILDSTVHLVLKDAKGQSKIGSGFFVRPELVVTNLYVVKGADSGYAKLVGKETKHDIEEITHIKECGLALLKVPAPGVKPLPLGDSEAVKKYGNPVYVVKTSPKLNRGQLLKGTAAYHSADRSTTTVGTDAVAVDGDGKIIRGPDISWRHIEWLRLTTQVSRESSGAPVLNSKGEVIGVSAHRGGTSGKTGNFAISSKTLNFALSLFRVQSYFDKEETEVEPKLSCSHQVGSTVRHGESIRLTYKTADASLDATLTVTTGGD